MFLAEVGTISDKRGYKKNTVAGCGVPTHLVGNRWYAVEALGGAALFGP